MVRKYLACLLKRAAADSDDESDTEKLPSELTVPIDNSLVEVCGQQPRSLP